ncbi:MULTISPECIES: tetratricopeptide repeat-containing sensor histidine kinase [Sphingobacterium]|uniref:Two-component sensor histidine kinase n=1 Tax=Sphingobacterium athyrii TaxID=2152717 RepID=A0A363NY22_9SPHI|nr:MULTISPECIES: ATP-binding protein [Sphingobacterium]PUV25623.1 two-component sensor histidine kinase [Sphingobacterium athyrii]QIH33611.1 sensor histidine kinase [Sphingobacterium sp. DR205]
MGCIHVFFKTFIICLVFLFSCCQLYAQEQLQELQKSYYNLPLGSKERFLLTGKYAQALYFANEKALASQLLNDNIQLAKNYPDKQYYAYLNCIAAMNSYNDHLFEKSRFYLEHAKSVLPIINDNSTKGYVYYCDGWIMTRQSKEDQAVSQFHKAITFLEKAPQTDANIARKLAIYKELTAIYANQRNYDFQEKYTNLLLETAKAGRNINSLFDAYMQAGYLFEEEYRSDRTDPNILKKAEEHYLEAYRIAKNNQKNLINPTDMAYVSVNLANLYHEFYPENSAKKATSFAQQALQIAQETGQYSLTVPAYGILADEAFKNGRRDQGKKYLQQALYNLQREPHYDYQVGLSLYSRLAEVSVEEGRYEEAFQYQKSYIKVFEEAFNSDKLDKTKQLEIKYERELQNQKLMRLRLEGEKKEQQIKLMKALNDRQNQLVENLKLNELNRTQQLKVLQLERDKKEKDLQLSRLENEQRLQELDVSKQEIAFKSRMNSIYIWLFISCLIAVILLFYAYWQRSNTLRQKEHLHGLEIEKNNQQHAIKNLTAMLAGEEKERTRLARDLHDGLGGLLSSTKLGLSSLSDKGANQPAVKEGITRSIELLDDAVDELRKLAHNLMPDLIVKYGLQEALRDYAARMSQPNCQVECEFLQFESNFSVEHQISLYRIIQELVNNALKHAEASNIIIQLSVYNERLHITIEDDGKGFDIEKIDLQHSAGMHNIQSRLSFLHGDMKIMSAPGEGTTIEIEMPLV